MNIKSFQLSREELEARLRWYGNKYGSYIGNRGVHNWKNLFGKPTFSEWTILFMLILMLFVGWAYQHDVAECKEFLLTIEDKACMICQTQIETSIPVKTLSVNEKLLLEELIK